MSASLRSRLGAVLPVAAVGLIVAFGPGPGAPGPRTYRPPTTAPVADPFRPPPQPWMAGNRGIEYATPPGTQVRAIGPGLVLFAGMVAGERDVTVRHPDGLRSSYVDLATMRVQRGDAVVAGQVIGLSTDRLHLGVRREDTYLDPASLWGTTVTGGRVVLVPDRDRSPPAHALPDERGPQSRPGPRRPSGAEPSLSVVGRAAFGDAARVMGAASRSVVDLPQLMAERPTGTEGPPPWGAGKATATIIDRPADRWAVHLRSPGPSPRSRSAHAGRARDPGSTETDGKEGR